MMVPDLPSSFCGWRSGCGLRRVGGACLRPRPFLGPSGPAKPRADDAARDSIASVDVIADLADEHAALDALLVDDAAELATPAEGWTIAD